MRSPTVQQLYERHPAPHPIRLHTLTARGVGLRVYMCVFAAIHAGSEGTPLLIDEATRHPRRQAAGGLYLPFPSAARLVFFVYKPQKRRYLAF